MITLKLFGNVLSGLCVVLLAASAAAAANPAKGTAGAAVARMPLLSVSPASVDFGSAGVNEYEYNEPYTVIIIYGGGGYSIKGSPKGMKAQIFQIKNVGPTRMMIDEGFAVFSPDACSLKYNGDRLCDFFVAANTCPPSLAPGGTCSLTVEFVPFRAGKIQTTLTLGGSSQGRVTIPLSGTGAGGPGQSLAAASTSEAMRVRNKQEVAVSVKDASSAIGQPVKLQATVKSKTYGHPIPNVDVRFKVGGKIVGTAKTGEDGTASYQYCTDWTLNPGGNPVSAEAVDLGPYSHGKGTGNLHVLKAATSVTVETIRAKSVSDVYTLVILGPNGLPLAETGLIYVNGYLQINYACVIDMISANPFWAKSVRVKSGGSTGSHSLSNEGKYETAFAHEIGKTDPVLFEVFFDGSEKLLPSANKLIVK